MLTRVTSRLTAQRLRLILIGTILLVIIVMGVVFFLARNVLVSYTADVSKITSEANSSSSDLAALSSLKTKLANNKQEIERAKGLVAESKSYAYQDQIIKDISTYAGKAGVAIAGFQFNDGGGATGGAAAPAAGSSTPAAGADPAGTAGTTPTASGLKTVSVSITLAPKLKYEALMNFVHLIEQNLTKMQLGGLSMTKDPETKAVNVSSLTIEVYVR